MWSAVKKTNCKARFFANFNKCGHNAVTAFYIFLIRAPVTLLSLLHRLSSNFWFLIKKAFLFLRGRLRLVDNNGFEPLTTRTSSECSTS